MHLAVIPIAYVLDKIGRISLKTQSAKAKVEGYNNGFVTFSLRNWMSTQRMSRSRSMGAGGEDLIMAKCREKFPYSVECKNQEKVNVWESYSQAVENSKDYEPVVVIKRNNHKPLVIVDAEYFVGLHKGDIQT